MEKTMIFLGILLYGVAFITLHIYAEKWAGKTRKKREKKRALLNK